jgi:hypothetical protein
MHQKLKKNILQMSSFFDLEVETIKMVLVGCVFLLGMDNPRLIGKGVY